MKKKNRKPTHIDLFAGPGGIATGFNASGFNTVLAVEYIESCCETYEANHPYTKVVCNDIREVSEKFIKSELKKQNIDEIDVVSAGFPCETFSTAGHSSRVYNDHRNDLYKEAIRIAKAVNARVLMLENVPAFLSKKIERGSNEKIYDYLIKDLIIAGYKYFHYEIVSALDFGVPQNRSRFILIANKEKPLKKFKLKKTGKKVSVNEALSDLPKIGPNTESNTYAKVPSNKYQKMMRSRNYWGLDGDDVNVTELSYHITPKHRSGTIERFKLIKHGENLKDLFDKLSEKEIEDYQKKRVLPKKWYIQRNYRLKPDEPSKTVTSHCLDELIHPSLDRGLSVREVARLQSFPDWYDFKGGPLLVPHIYKTQDKYEQIGDAVPPLMAMALGQFIQEELL